MNLTFLVLLLSGEVCCGEVMSVCGFAIGGVTGSRGVRCDCDEFVASGV